MAQQEEGWPLGLQPLNVRVGLTRNHGDNLGSVSFSTLLTGSPTSSSDSCSDLDTESTGSFFHDKSITLGSLIGVSGIFELSKRSLRGRKTEAVQIKVKKSNKKSKPWLFSLCSRDTTDAENVTDNNPPPPSLGHFLAVERRAASNGGRRNQCPNIYEPDEIPLDHPRLEPNSLFVNDRIATPQSIPRNNEHGNESGIPVLFSCMCGRSSH